MELCFQQSSVDLGDPVLYRVHNVFVDSKTGGEPASLRLTSLSLHGSELGGNDGVPWRGPALDHLATNGRGVRV